MKFVKSTLTVTGAVILAGCILAMVAPKAAKAIVATAVQVVNTTAAPVPNKDVDQPGRHAFVQSCAQPINSNHCSMQPPVPAGSVFVVQTISADQLDNDATPAVLYYSTTTNTVNNTVTLPVVAEYNFPQHALTLANVNLYQDPGTTPLCAGSGNGSQVFQNCVASGYLVTVP